jgi:hypothetical protein
MTQRTIHFPKLFIHTKLIACAHSCKYCLMGNKKLARLPIERIIAFLERFLEWEQANKATMPVSYVLNYTSDYNRRTLELVADLDRRFPRSYPPLSGITLGGLPWRPENELRDWLLERQEFGCKTAHASLAGTGSVHDYWNGKSGNFDLIMTTLRIAGEIGMGLGARLFVTKSTLPLLSDLNALLEQMPKHDNDWRYALPFFYAGWGAKLEDERIDEDIRDSLPDWLDPLIKQSAGEGFWRSEREWIAHIETLRPQKIETNLIVNVTEANIERLEAMSCDDIVAKYEMRTRAAYAAMPDLHELSARYGDKNDRRLYVLQRCIEMKWLDMYLRDHPAQFERQLTHLQMGN